MSETAHHTHPQADHTIGHVIHDQKVEAPEPKKPTKPKAERIEEKVLMADGREVIFIGKRRMLKESFFRDDGSFDYTRLDFRNGQTRQFVPVPALRDRFMAHGIEQKLGDESAGIDDVDDAVVETDELIEQLNAGEWGVKREGGMSGVSILIKALQEGMGKTEEAVKAFLKGKSGAERTALSNHSRIKPIFQRLMDEKAAKAAHIDSDALLAGLDAQGA